MCRDKKGRGPGDPVLFIIGDVCGLKGLENQKFSHIRGFAWLD